MLCAVTLGLLCVSALVSGAETSFFSLSHKDIRRLQTRTTASAEAVLHLLTNVDVLLATILVVNNLVCRALNAAAAVGFPKVDAQVIAGC